MKLALTNVEGDRFALTEETLQEGFGASAASPRKRMILPLHRTQDAAVQRMLNFFQPGTYVQPHVHPGLGQIETVQVLRGAIGFILFRPDGEVDEIVQLQEGGLGLIDIEPGLWHGMVCLAPDTVVLEIKKGPYDATTDKTFADWAPAEGDDGAEEYLARMISLFAA